jgi:hypothetical protein
MTHRFPALILFTLFSPLFLIYVFFFIKEDNQKENGRDVVISTDHNDHDPI